MRMLFMRWVLWTIPLAGLMPHPTWGQAPTRISALTPNGILVWTNTQADRVYRIQTATPPGQSWTNLGNAVPGTGAVMQATVPVTNAAALFRIADIGTCCTNSGGTNFGSSVSLGTYCADSAVANSVNLSGCGNGWFRIRANECNPSLSATGNNLKVSVTLASPLGVDYDLYLYNSNGTPSYASTQSGTNLEVISWTVTDPPFSNSDESFDFMIEVRRFSGVNCAAWTLSATLGGP